MSSLSMVLPKIETDATSKNYGRYIIGPLERGYGVTLGNALRRVLLSSLPGAAVTSIRVSDVHHEFSDIPYVREDMTMVILQIKQLRVKLHGEEPVRLRLEVRGEGTVTAGDIQCPPEVEIINPDLYLFTVDSDKARLEMELTVEPGRGYSYGASTGQDISGQDHMRRILSLHQPVVSDVFRAVQGFDCVALRDGVSQRAAKQGQRQQRDQAAVDQCRIRENPPRHALAPPGMRATWWRCRVLRLWGLLRG